MSTAPQQTEHTPPLSEGAEIEVNGRRYPLTHLRTEIDATWGDISVGGLDLPVCLDRLAQRPSR